MALTKTDAAFYISWLAEAGVRDVPAEKPTDFYQLQPKHNTPTITQSPSQKTRKTPPPTQDFTPPLTQDKDITEALADATQRASQANNLDELKKQIEAFDYCELKKFARSLVFSDGAPQASVMIIGEAPGEQEDRSGVPFVGQAGKLLDKMLGAINLSRESVYIINILPWRPPANRNPLPEERAMFRPFVNRHIGLIAPKIILLLGSIAAKEMLATETGITKLRGQWQKMKIGAKEYDTLPTFHPAYLLRQQSQKKLAWEDLQSLQKKIEEKKIEEIK